MQKLRHLKIEGRHDLTQHLDNGDRKSSVDEVFRHFEPDEAAADDGCGFEPLLLH
ncbi:hypothetical protein SDC9_102640 [bioreactor metagenome]|uniref:Uncharacterized protein n=1 Tax=bioreactor metagenome TaxID=1076179 RepID=A0A645AY95_9ZZZZ